jgi:hypothetical protein
MIFKVCVQSTVSLHILGHVKIDCAYIYAVISHYSVCIVRCWKIQWLQPNVKCFHFCVIKKDACHAAEKLIFLGEHLGLWEQMNFGDIKECTSGNK